MSIFHREASNIGKLQLENYAFTWKQIEVWGRVTCYMFVVQHIIPGLWKVSPTIKLVSSR